MSIRTLVATALLVALAACNGSETKGAVSMPRGKVAVVTTISTLNSFVQGVGGNFVTVQNIVPVGASPETYEPTPQDVATVANAHILVENGAGLETWIDKLLHNAGSSNLKIVDCAAGLPVKFNNPHLWMDPILAKEYVLKIRDALIFADPQHGPIFRKNAAAYNRQLDALTRRIRYQIDTIPPSQRYMIVFHNAWQYYNDRFGITTLGFVERNPGQDPNPEQIASLIDLAKQHGVRAIFSEPEYSPKIVQQIAAGAGVKIVENLYDDSIGTTPQLSNYIGMLDFDTKEIVKALK